MTSAAGRMRSFILTMAITQGLLLLYGSRALAGLLYRNAHPLAWVMVVFAVFGMFMCIYGPFVSSGKALREEVEREAREQTPFVAKSEVVAWLLPVSYLLIGGSCIIELPLLWASPTYPVVAKGIITAITFGFIGICVWAAGDKFLRWRIALRQEKASLWNAS